MPTHDLVQFAHGENQKTISIDLLASKMMMEDVDDAKNKTKKAGDSAEDEEEEA